MKINRKICILTISSLTILMLQTANAKRFYQDDYDIDIMAKEKNKKVKIWGKVAGGIECTQMYLDVYLKNSVTGQNLHFNTYLDDYSPIGRNNFKTHEQSTWDEQKQFHNKTSKHSWYVDDFYLKCNTMEKQLTTKNKDINRSTNKTAYNIKEQPSRTMKSIYENKKRTMKEKITHAEKSLPKNKNEKIYYWVDNKGITHFSN